jgi:hypothetical protein
MARLRARRSLVFLALGLVLFAAFVPAAAASLAAAILVPLWLLLPAAAITLIRREASHCDEQPASLLSLVRSRAPPSRLAFA